MKKIICNLLFALSLVFSINILAEEPKTINILIEQANRGDVEAQYRLGEKYLRAEGVLEDKKKAFKYLELAAEQGDDRAYVLLGLMYEHDFNNYEKAMIYYKLASDKGNVRGQTLLGNMYEFGNGVEPNDEEAIKYYKLAAAQGDEWGQRFLDSLQREYKSNRCYIGDSTQPSSDNNTCNTKETPFIIKGTIYSDK